jgi:hypothetical protein
MQETRLRWSGRLVTGVAAVGTAIALTGLVATASTPGTDVRLSNDQPGGTGYVSNYNINHPGAPVAKDDTLTACSTSRGRENEPAVAVNPRNTQVIVGSSNDYCGVYNDGVDADGAPIPAGPIWLGYYRSQNGGSSFQSSLVPGYPGDNTPYAARAHIRTASSGDPVLAWDGDGRLFAGSESSDDPAGTKKTFGDEWVATYENPAGTGGSTINDGKEFKRSVVVAKGSSAPNLNGKFNDKTAIAADRTNNSKTRGNVYFSWSRFTNGKSDIYFVRSTDHGATFTQPKLLTTSEDNVQGPDIAINGDGTVTITWASTIRRGQTETDAVRYVVSRNGGATFSKAATATTFEGYDAQDQYVDGSVAGDCGSLGDACVSGYHFYRRDSAARSAADQTNASDHRVWITVDVLDKPVPSQQPTYGMAGPGVAGRSIAKVMNLDVATGAASALVPVDVQPTGQQDFPDIAVEAGVVHLLWWDTRNDPCYSPARPIGNCADGSITNSQDAYGTAFTSLSAIPAGTRLSDVTTDPNWEQFDGRSDPFAGDYLWVDSAGGRTFSVWTDYRNTRPADAAHNDKRDTDHKADVYQCRDVNSDGSVTGDKCPTAGGLDQDIYGDQSP